MDATEVFQHSVGSSRTILRRHGRPPGDSAPRHSAWLPLVCFLLLGTASRLVFGASPGVSPISVEEVRTHLSAAEASTTLEPAEKAEVVALYQQALRDLGSAAREREQAQAYSKQLQEAPAQIIALRRQLKTAERTASIVTPDNPAEMEKRLLRDLSERARLQTELADVSAAALAERELDLPELIAAAQQKQSAGQTADPTGASSGLAEARRVADASQLQAERARLETLQQRLLSRDARLELWDVRQRLLRRKIDFHGQQITALQTAVNALRQDQAGETAKRAESRAMQLDNEPEVVRELAANNAGLAERVVEVATRTEALRDMREDLTANRERLARYYDSISQQLAITGAEDNASLGAEMLKLRRRLRESRISTIEAKELDQELTSARLAQLPLEDNRVTGLDEVGISSREFVKQLLAENQAVVENAVMAYRRYVEELTATRAEARLLDDRKAELQRLLGRHLLWIPSTEPISIRTWAALGGELRWLFSARQWGPVAVDIRNRPGDLIGVAIPLGLLLGFFAMFRRRFQERLSVITGQIGNVWHDRMIHTWAVLIASLLLALPGPAILASGALLLRDAGVFSAQLELGLRYGATLLFLLEAFRQLCRTDGLAEAHFKWSPHALSVTRRNLPWLTLVLVPFAILTPVLDGSINGSNGYDALGRLLFFIASVALAGFAHSVLRPTGAFLSLFVSDGPDRPVPLQRWLYPLAVLSPLLLLGLSWSGYHFTALQLESKLFVTVCILVGAVLLFYLILRALSVTERRMALERLYAESTADRERNAQRQATGKDGPAAPTYDLQTINQQTRAFVRLLVVFGTMLALWNLWSEVLPALGVLDSIHLWSIAGSDGAPERMVALGDLVTALLIALVTYFGARNIPGSLEVSILRRLKLEPGTSYAVTTITKYVILLVGIAVVLNLVGAEWSKLQWLVAALSVGLGFGLQEIVANFISGLLILFERPIRVGDTVTIGGHTGTVSKIRIRATTLTDWDRKEQIIPNKSFITEQLTNWTLSDSITRVIVRVGVAYGSAVEEVTQVLLDIVRQNSRTVTDPPPAVFFVGFGDSSLNFEIRAFVRAMEDLMPLTHELHTRIATELKARQIEIPFPQRDLHIRSSPVAAVPSEVSEEGNSPHPGDGATLKISVPDHRTPFEESFPHAGQTPGNTSVPLPE